MRDALLRDLSLLDYVVHTTVDARLAPPEGCDRTVMINHQDDIWQIWQAEMLKADAVWIVAPETDGYLERLTALAVSLNRAIIGCDVDAVKHFSDKLLTNELLKQANIAHIPSYSYNSWIKEGAASWLAKPKDGAGCEDAVIFETAEQLTSWLLSNHKQASHIIQPYLSGDAGSITCVIHQGHAKVLSCNQQLITIKRSQLCFEGCVVNGMQQYWEAFEKVANQIARLFNDDVTAFIGIDVIVNEGHVTVVEVNPRLTTSYVALSEATGINPAELIMQLSEGQYNTSLTIDKNVVNVDLGAQYA